jgi:isopentenyl diphosphate isomerase/L-lactate dehydrogenase-like FMN-dependent dehydrogenase
MLSVEDYRTAARKRLPDVVFEYIDGGAESEATVRANRAAFEAVTLCPRGGMDPSKIDLRTTLLGRELTMPLILAPCGSSRAMNSGGDKAGAIAAAAKGTLFVQSTMSGHGVAEVVDAAQGSPVWYQAYRVGDQATAARAIERARDAGAEALVLTIDTAVVSLRERDRRTGGMALLGQSNLRAARHAIKLARHPRWLADRVLDGVRPKLMNALDENGKAPILGRSATTAGLGWHDLPWIREIWPGPIVIKGVLTVSDAERSLAEGAAAIVISNHGGRQLDSADATLSVLPEIAAAVGGRCPVILDSGVRSGIDVLKALCLGADVVGIGRPWLYGLAVGGQAGVEAVLQLFYDGIARNMALLGASRPSELDTTFARAPQEWFERRSGSEETGMKSLQGALES